MAAVADLIMALPAVAVEAAVTLVAVVVLTRVQHTAVAVAVDIFIQLKSLVTE
jgi:hypothetical protein